MNKLRKFLDDEGLRYDFFAKKIGVSQPTLTRYLKGFNKPKIDTALIIQKITKGKVSIEDWCSKTCAVNNSKYSKGEQNNECDTEKAKI